MAKKKGIHVQQGNTSDKHAKKITEAEQVLQASTNIDKKLLRQMEKQKEDDEYIAKKEAEQKKAAVLKKKTNKGNRPKQPIEFSCTKPEEAVFKGTSESKKSYEFPKNTFESPQAVRPTDQQKRDGSKEGGFRGMDRGNASFSARKDYKHPRICNPAYDIQKRDGPKLGFRGDSTKFSAPYYNKKPYNSEMQKRDLPFQDFMQKKNIKCDHIEEKTGDLFSAPEEYSLAHCVAEDFNMGAGIALTFRAKYKQVSNLLNQNKKTGGLAVLKHEKRFIYYLITKEKSRGKPTLHTLWLSLLKLKEHCEANNVTKLAIPQIGCGLDRLDWIKVKQMLAHIFEGTPVEIVVYIWEKSATEDPQMSKTLKKCFVVHKVLPLIQIPQYTGLIYFAAVDGFETEQMSNIAVRCPALLSIYKREPKRLGDAVCIEDGKEFIYGLVVKPNTGSAYDFTVMEKALRNLRDVVAKDKYEYVAFEGFVDLNDEIWVCWPEHLQQLCPLQY